MKKKMKILSLGLSFSCMVMSLFACADRRKTVHELFEAPPVALTTADGEVRLNDSYYKWDANLKQIHPRADGFTVSADVFFGASRQVVADIGAFRKADGHLFHDSQMDHITVRGVEKRDGQDVQFEKEYLRIDANYVRLTKFEGAEKQIDLFDPVGRVGQSYFCEEDHAGNINKCLKQLTHPTALEIQNEWKELQKHVCVPFFKAFEGDLRFARQYGGDMRAVVGRDYRARELKMMKRKEEFKSWGICF